MGRSLPTLVNMAWAETHDVLFLRLPDNTVKRLGTAVMNGVPLLAYSEITPNTPVDLEVDIGNYVAHLMRSSSTRQALTQAADRVTLEVQNVDTVIGVTLNLIETTLTGAKAVFGKVFKQSNGAWTSSPQLYGEVDDVHVDQNNATLTIVSDTAPNVSFLTNRPIQKTCPLAFKGVRCGYTGPLTTCNKKRDDEGGCSGRDNVHRFGGFIPDGELAQPIIGTGFGDVSDPDVNRRGGRYPDQDGGRIVMPYTIQ